MFIGIIRFALSRFSLSQVTPAYSKRFGKAKAFATPVLPIVSKWIFDLNILDLIYSESKKHFVNDLKLSTTEQFPDCFSFERPITDNGYIFLPLGND